MIWSPWSPDETTTSEQTVVEDVKGKDQTEDEKSEDNGTQKAKPVNPILSAPKIQRAQPKSRTQSGKTKSKGHSDAKSNGSAESDKPTPPKDESKSGSELGKGTVEPKEITENPPKNEDSKPKDDTTEDQEKGKETPEGYLGLPDFD